MEITTRTNWYGKGSLKLYKATKKIVDTIVEQIILNDCEMPSHLWTKSEDFGANIGVYARVWMQAGYIFKWSRDFEEPCRILRKLIVPTVVVEFETEYGGKMWLIVQKKIFGAVDYYKMREKRKWGKMNTVRFRHWHNLVHWFARGTDWTIKHYNEYDYSPATIFYSVGAEYLDVSFRDVHAENIGFDNGQLKVLDW